MIFFAVNVKAKKPAKYTIINNKCKVDVAMKWFHTNVMHLLNVDHRKLLIKTPFLHLFVIPRGVTAPNAILHHILCLWDSERSLFRFHHRNLMLNSKEISTIMCLPSTGDMVNIANVRSTPTRLRQKFFPGMRTISRSQLEKVIEAALKNDCPEMNCPANEVVSLLVLYIFTTILFPNTGGSVPMHLFGYVENLDRLNSYNWGGAVFDMLAMHIPNAALWCQLQESDELVESEGSESGYLSGCALALIVSYLAQLFFFIIVHYRLIIMF